MTMADSISLSASALPGDSETRCSRSCLHKDAKPDQRRAQRTAVEQNSITASTHVGPDVPVLAGQSTDSQALLLADGLLDLLQGSLNLLGATVSSVDLEEAVLAHDDDVLRLLAWVFVEGVGWLGRDARGAEPGCVGEIF
jgi:hypothetical protein